MPANYKTFLPAETQDTPGHQAVHLARMQDKIGDKGFTKSNTLKRKGLIIPRLSTNSRHLKEI